MSTAAFADPTTADDPLDPQNARRKQLLTQLAPSGGPRQVTGKSEEDPMAPPPLPDAGPPLEPSPTPPVQPPEAPPFQNGNPTLGPPAVPGGTPAPTSRAPTGEEPPGFAPPDPANGPSTVTPAVPAAPTAPTLPRGSTDPAGILAIVNEWASHPGANPSLRNDPNYWVQRIIQSGGWDEGYWTGRFMQPEGAPEGAPAGTSGPMGPTTPLPAAPHYQPTAAAPQVPQPATMPASQDPGMDASFRAALLKLLDQSQQPVSITDPNLAGQAEAYRVAATRGAQDTRSAAAERMAQEGLNSGGAGSGAFDTAINGINEQAGQAEAGFNANLVGKEVQQRRAALVQALDMASAVGARKEEESIRLALANLDKQYQYASLNQEQSQFQDTTTFNYAELAQRYAQLAQQDSQFRASNGLSYAQLAQRYAELAQQQWQFEDTTEFNYWDRQEQANRSAITDQMRG